MRKRLLLLGVLGVLMTLAVTWVALLSLAQVGTVNRELAQVNRALRYHQDADMMHDALRADVSRAQLDSTGRPWLSPDTIRRQTQRHADRFRADLRDAASVRLGPDLRNALDRLRPRQETYIVTAESMVHAALDGRGGSLAEQASYEAAYRQLVPRQAEVTDMLVATSAQVERTAATRNAHAERMIAIATVAALGGWLALIAWHNRSMHRLRDALLREAEQRSTADLLQSSLLPSALPSVPGVRLAARSMPGSAAQVGGDWYDAITLPDGRLCLVVGDVVGHDLPAATVMGQLRNALRAYALEDSSPASVLARVNRAAYHLGASDLATCVCVVLDPETLEVSWASAGHPPPLVSSATGTTRLLTGEPGPPLGVTPAAAYDRHEVRLAPGDALLLFSDGLVERRGTTIDSGLSALENTVLPRHAGPEAMSEHLVSTLLGDGSGHDDDVTLLMLHVDERPVELAAPAHRSYLSRRRRASRCLH